MVLSVRTISVHYFIGNADEKEGLFRARKKESRLFRMSGTIQQGLLSNEELRDLNT